MSFDDASAALSAAANSPEPATPGFENVPTPGNQPATPSTEVAPGTTGTPDSFTGLDPNSLPAELQESYRRMQADYTRKTQEIAEQRKSFDGIDPTRARQSLDFIEALETDPNFVVTVHAQLTQALQEAGMSPQQASAHAAEAIQNESSLGGGEETDPDSGLAKEVADLRQWKEQQEAQQHESNLAAHLQRQEMGIRQADPSLQEAEIDRIYELAFAHGGDLVKAHASYSQWKNDVLGSYIDRKAEVPNVGVPDSTGFAQTPRSSFTFDEGHDAAKAHLANVLANS